MKTTLVLGLSWVMMAGVASAQAPKQKQAEKAMSLHHLHMSMLDHGLGMAAEGSNLVMLSEMGMAAEFNPTTRAHGQAMLKGGKELIERALSGEEMKGLHEKAGTEGAVMRQTHELGEAMKAVVNLLEDMRVAEPKPGEMTVHHMHMALNHALAMAAEGSDLIMLGEMGMAPKVDTASVEHGKAMLADARQLWDEVMKGKAMQGMMGAEPSEVMSKTHELAEVGKKVIDLLEKMHASSQ
ncbi:MAG: hypothetical protein ACREXU_13205 [Gammaproteobacteria bacterium]